MTSEKEKGKVELAVFKDFLKAAPFTIDTGSEHKVYGVSLPDIKCSIKGKTLYFELAESCVPEFAEAEAGTLKEDSPYATFGHDISDEIVKKKLNKIYNVKDPVELLIYTHGRNGLPDAAIIDKIEPLLNEGLGQFERIWFYGRDKIVLLAEKDTD